MHRGKLIVIDGADGAGKKTQTALLVARLREEGMGVETLDFPRYQDNFFGKLIRECLDGKRGDFMKTDARIASVLYAADRFESREMIEGWLNEGKTVVLDRYASSNMLHQGAKIDDPNEVEEFLPWLDHMEHEVFKIPRPDLILYLDVPHKVRFNLIENDTTRASIDVAEANLEHQIASEERARRIVARTGNWRAINCTDGDDLKTKEEIHEAIYAVVKANI